MSNNQIHPPIYDPYLSYEENFAKGPFNAFADGQVVVDQGEPEYDFFGYKVYLPFGVPAGPLLNGKFVKAALDKGFDIPWYKTVRSKFYPCHPKPNCLPVKIEGDLTLQQADQGLQEARDYTPPIAITNSFGVPSQDPEIWQPDLIETIKYAKKGQLVVASFQGTNRGLGGGAFVQDYVDVAKLVFETGAKVVEANFSCPNEGTCDLLCYDTNRVLEITRRIKEVIGNTPLLIKLAYFEDQNHLADYVQKIGQVVDGFSAINTISAEIRKADGSQALPGEGRLRSGVCGAPIKWAGVDMVKRLNQLRVEFGMNYKIVASGGVTTPEDFGEYRKAGADVVTSATGMMWNPYLAQEIKKSQI